MEVSVLIHQARYLVGGRHRTPAVINSFARQCEVQAKVCVRMRFGIVGNLWKPWAGHHQARGIDPPALQSFNGSSIYRVGFAQIVRMDNDELCAGWVSELLYECLRRNSDRERGHQGTEQQYWQNERRSHRRLVNHSPPMNAQKEPGCECNRLISAGVRLSRLYVFPPEKHDEEGRPPSRRCAPVIAFWSCVRDPPQMTDAILYRLRGPVQDNSRVQDLHYR